MAKPKFTDAARYPNGYRDSKHTNVAATFRRERERLKAAAEQAAKDEAERQEKVRRMARK